MYQKRLIAGLVSIFTLGIVFGILTEEYDSFYYRAFFVTLAVISVIYLVVAPKQEGVTISKRMTAAALAVAAFSFGAVYLSLYTAMTEPENIYSYYDDISNVEVVEANSNSIDAYVIESDCKTIVGKTVRIYANNISDYNLIPGDNLSITAKFQANDSIAYLSNGISVVGYGTIEDMFDGSGFFYSIRKSISNNSILLFGDFDAVPGISKAVTTGDRSSMDSYLFSIYKSAGISHVLAISGLHISLIAMSLYNFLIILSVNRKACCIIASLVGVAYAGLVGFTPGAVRAAVMLIFLLVSRMFLRRSDGITALFTALLILLIINPYSIASAGLQLSFLCSLGIIISEPLQYKMRCFFSKKKIDANMFLRVLYTLSNAITTSFLISFVSSIFSFPVLCLSFDTISYVSPIVNLIAVPLFTTAIKFALVSFIIAPISSSIATLIAYPAGVLFDFVTDIARLIYDWDFGNISVHISYMYVPLLFSFVIIFSLVFLSKRRIAVFLLSSCMFCLSLFCCGLYNKADVSSKFISEYCSKSNKYVYYQTPDVSVYMDLGGYTSKPDVIYKNGKTSLDEYVVLNYDSYSFVRFDYLSGSLKVNKVNLPNPENSYQMSIYNKIYDIAEKRNCEVGIYTECYEYLTEDNSLVQVFVSNYKDTTGTLICIDLDGYNVEYLDNEYGRAVNCDVAVLLDEYSGEFYNVIADEIFIMNQFASINNASENQYRVYQNGLKIEKHLEERELNFYEP